MALGPQFENTYWHTGDKNEPFGSSAVPAKPEERKALKGRPVIGPGPLELADGVTGGANLQGMLFSPYVGTGLKRDPLVSPERRNEVAERALGFRNDDGMVSHDEYRRNAHRAFGGRASISDKSVDRDRAVMRDALVGTDMPIQEMERVRATAVRDPRPGRAWAEIGGGLIRMTRQQSKSQTVIPAHTEERFRPKDPIANTKFWDWHKKNLEDNDFSDASEWLTEYDNASIRWMHPETGETISNPDLARIFPGEDPDTGKLDVYSADRRLSYLKDSGYVPNLFPGAGKDSSKQVSRTKRLPTGWSYHHDRETSINMHTRYTPGEETEHVKVPRKVITEKQEYASRATLTHEIGHSRDTTGNNYGRLTTADPLLEGLADGYQSRFNTPVLDSHLRSTDYDAASPSDHSGRHYGAKHATFGNRVGQALYTAMRSHVVQGDRNYADAPSRAAVARELGIDLETHWVGEKPDDPKSFRHLNRMTLGHTWEHFPHVRKHLEAAGYGDVARETHAEYLSAKKESDIKKYGEQLSFDI